MILLDTDTLTLLCQGHARVKRRVDSAETDVAIAIIACPTMSRFASA